MKTRAATQTQSREKTRKTSAPDTLKSTDTNDSILAAWDLYTDGDWPALIQLQPTHQDNAATAAANNIIEIADLIAAGRYEAADGGYDPGTSTDAQSLFGPLRNGMAACYQHEYANAADLLGRWLLEREYYAPVVLRRFVESALSGARYRLLGEVCKKFLSKPALQKLALEGFFLSNFHQEKHKEAILVFEKFREQFDDVILLQKAALSLMRLERYQDAEALLAPLYARLSGAEYQMRYDEVRASYQTSIKNRATLAKKSNRTNEESMELGMAYLFSSEYDHALQVFQHLMKSQAA